MEIDDSSVKWIDCDCNVVRLPIATINTLLLGPGTTITHEAVKVMVAANCSVCWVGEDSLLFLCGGAESNGRILAICALKCYWRLMIKSSVGVAQKVVLPTDFP